MEKLKSKSLAKTIREVKEELYEEVRELREDRMRYGRVGRREIEIEITK